MELVFGYLAGLLTLLNPCVLPVLPIVLASALQADRSGPLWLVGGMMASFVVIGLTISSVGPAIGLNEDRITQIGALMMLGFGSLMLVPRLQAGFATATGGVAMRADAMLDRLEQARRGAQGMPGPAAQAVGGALLGAVWSPCIGPTLGAAIALASQGGDLWHAGSVMLAFSAGVGSFMLLLAYGARGWLARSRPAMMGLSQIGRPVMGAVFVGLGLVLLMGWHHRLEAALLMVLPEWFVDFSVVL